MPLTRVKTNIAKRFNVVGINLRHLEASEVQIHHQHGQREELTDIDLHNVHKGLYFVHLYSALEKSINEVVERVLLTIETSNVVHKHYSTAFNSIALDSKLTSYKMASRDRAMECIVTLFNTMSCETHTKINESMFESKLQNVWFETVQQILLCFGIDSFEDENGRMKTAIDEVVEKRNAVAHGRIPVDKVGERQRCDVLIDRTTSVRSFLDIFIYKMETYLKNKNYINENYRVAY